MTNWWHYRVYLFLLAKFKRFNLLMKIIPYYHKILGLRGIPCTMSARNGAHWTRPMSSSGLRRLMMMSTRKTIPLHYPDHPNQPWKEPGKFACYIDPTENQTQTFVSRDRSVNRWYYLVINTIFYQNLKMRVDVKKYKNKSII